MIGTIIFCPGPFMHPHLQHIHLWFQRKADGDGAYPEGPVLPWPDRCPNNLLILVVKYARKILKSTRRVQVASTLLFKIFQKGNDHLIHLAWDETISAATPLHCLSMGLLSNCQNLQKVGHDIVIFNGNVLVHAWHTWCKKGTNRKRMSCSSPMCHMHKFSNHLTLGTLGLWIWITFILIRTVYNVITSTIRMKIMGVFFLVITSSVNFHFLFSFFLSFWTFFSV